MTACARFIAVTWPRLFARRNIMAVMSVAYSTTLNGCPSGPQMGMYIACSQISRPSLVKRLYSLVLSSPRSSLLQKLRYSALSRCAGSTNMLWCLPRISRSVNPSAVRKFSFAVRTVPSMFYSSTAWD